MTGSPALQYILTGFDDAASSRFSASVAGDTDKARVTSMSVSQWGTVTDAEFVCFVKSPGTLAPHATSAILAYFASHPDVDMLFTDESKADGRASTPVLKPIYAPERLRTQDYLGDLVVYRSSLLDAVGGVDDSLPGAELYDLEMRASLAARVVGHIDAPLFRRTAGPARLADDATIKASTRSALERRLAATGGGEVIAVGLDGVHDTRRVVDGAPLVSLVIPSRGVFSDINGERGCYLLDCVRSVMEKSTYSNFEIVVVLDSVADPAVIDELHRVVGDRLVLAEWSKPFNFSDKINLGVLNASGEYVLMLNDDTTVISPGWIEALLALAQRPGAGMSGALLFFGDGSIQHAGHHYFEDDASHIGLDAAHDEVGPLSGYRVEREVSGVTAACALMPVRVFHEVGGLSNLLPGNFNDVDLCMKVGFLGYDIYFTPHAQLYHYESKTRDASVHGFEVDVVWTRWGPGMHDPRFWPYPHNRTPD